MFRYVRWIPLEVLLLALLLPGRFHAQPYPEAQRVPALGVNLPPEALDNEALLHRLARGPLRLVRFTLPWAEVELEPRVYRWGPWDRRLEALRRLGLTPVLVLDTTPRWARAPEDAPNLHAPPARPEDLAAFAAAVAQRYGSWVTYYQVWDEPNIAPHWGHREADPFGYVRLLQLTALALRRSDPDARILSAGLAPTLDPGRVNRNDLAYFRAFLDLGGAEWVDIVAWEPYGFRSPPDESPGQTRLNFRRTELARALLDRRGYGSVPMWGVAFGWNAIPGSPWEGVGVERQALYARQAVHWSGAHWPRVPVLLWTHAFPSASPEDPVRGFALWDPDLTPRPVGRALEAFPFTPLSPPPRREAPLWLPRGRGERFDVWVSGTAVTLEVGGGPRWHTWWVEVDGEPANGLPHVKGHAYLNLYAPRSLRETRVIAHDLPPGRHHVVLVSGPGDPVWPLWRVLSGRVDDGPPLGLQFAGALLFLPLIWWLLGRIPFLKGGWPRAVRGLVVLAGLTLPFASRPLSWGHGVFLLPEVVLQLAVPAAVFTLWRRRDALQWAPISPHSGVRWGIAWVGALLLAHAWFHRGEGAVWVALRARLLFPFLLYVLLRGGDEETRRAFSRALVLGGSVLAAWALADGVWHGVLWTDGVPRVRAFFGSPNHLALVLVRVLPFALFLRHAQGRRRWGGTWGLGLMGVALALTFSRGAWVLAVPVLLGLWWQGRFHGRKRWLWGGIVVLGLLLTAYRGGETGHARWLIWQGTARLVLDAPWLGIGWGRFTLLYPRYALPSAWREPLIYHAHNVLLTTAAWVGLPTTLILGGLWVRVLGRRPAAPLERAAWVSLWAGMAFGWVDAFWALEDLAYLTAVALALLSPPPHSNQ